MARRTKGQASPETRPANLSVPQMKAGIPKFEKRIKELEQVEIDHWDDGVQAELDALQTKVEDTLMGVFGHDTHEYKRFAVHHFWNYVSMSTLGTPDFEWVNGYKQAITNAILKLRTAKELLEEKLEELGETSEGRALQTMEGMDIHPAIHSAAWQRYRDGHYADAIETACKALDNLVQIKSGRFDLYGTDLMRTVFSAKDPVLCFVNYPYEDKHDQGEQEGMMHLYEGVTLALRNPRAHKLVDDDPERAMEFIGFISLLAKLLDEVEVRQV